jgi:PadR family transcriptional regulator, regulatory protein PadR
MAETEIDLLRSSLDLLILKALSWGPRHGYAVAEWIELATDDALSVEEGTLYPALHRLEHGGFVRSRWKVESGRRRRIYELTNRGRRELAAQESEWRDFVRVIDTVLGT